MKNTSINQSKRLVEMGLNPLSADFYYRDWKRHTELIRLVHMGVPTKDDLPCWSYDKLLDILTENNIGFEYKHARLSGHENIEIEVFKFNEEEDYIFRKHFKSILEAVEYCLENGYIKENNF